MSTAAQQQANKENAQHSTGPRTDEGKQRSSLNALKHGFRAKDPLIPGEDPDEFHRHRRNIAYDFEPLGAVEENLVEQIADITWRLKRFARIESAVINEFYGDTAKQSGNQDCDGDELLGKSIAGYANLPALGHLSRYESQLARRYHSAMKELRELRKENRRGRFASLGTRLPAEPQAASNGQAEKTEPTRSIATLLESIAPMNSPSHEPDPSDSGITEFYRMDPESPEQVAHMEAAK